MLKDLLAINNATAEQYHADRRGFLKLGLGSVAALGFWMPGLGHAGQTVTGREITMVNAHTGYAFKGEYWYDGKYLPDAFREIKALMRDHRTGEKFPIDPRLMDILFVLHNRMDSQNSFKVFSGYRSPKTNAMLKRRSEGVASGSLHMSGQAVDLKLPGAKLSALRKQAMALKSGGVGFYPKSDFVHIDTGRVRTW